MIGNRQWINWVPVPNIDPTKKPDKVPFDVSRMCNINPHDPANWLTYDEARARDPHHYGLVLTANDPYWCIDLDHAWNGAEWSPMSQAVCDAFPGAYVEVSYSGDGLHIIGTGIPPDGYKTRGPGVEFYTQERFIAITGTGAHGSMDPDHTAALHQFVPVYLKPDVAVPGGLGEWTDTHAPEHKLIEDDDALIAKMRRARPSAAVAFGGKASVKDLWDRNSKALAECWPQDNAAGFGESEADGALAAHLAYWTGKNCARMERLMRASKLLRAKWDDRGHRNYLRTTILGACATVQKVYSGPPVGEVNTAVGELRTGGQYLPVDLQMEKFKGCVWIASVDKVLTTSGVLLGPAQFKTQYAGYEFQLTADGSKSTVNAYEAFTASRATHFPKAHAMCFRPDLEPATIFDHEGLTTVNVYVPPVIVSSDADVSPFLHHMELLFPDDRDREIMLCYLAAIRQYPGTKFRWAPLIQGVEGNGKNIITDCAERAISTRFSHKLNSKEFIDSGSKFTGWLFGKLLIVVDEIHARDRREFMDTLKPFISDDRVEIQFKGADQFTGDNRANFILTSNHKDALMMTADTRRFAIFYTAQQTVEDKQRDGLNDAYMMRLVGWLHNHGGFAAVNGWLQRYKITADFNPATECVTAPRTSSTDEAVDASRGAIEQDVLTAVQEGAPGFCGGYVSSVALARLLVQNRRTISQRARSTMMEALGYVRHPALANGQLNTRVWDEENKRPVIYIKKGSVILSATNPSLIMQEYMKAQGYGMAAFSGAL